MENPFTSEEIFKWYHDKYGDQPVTFANYDEGVDAVEIEDLDELTLNEWGLKMAEDLGYTEEMWQEDLDTQAFFDKLNANEE